MGSRKHRREGIVIEGRSAQGSKGKLAGTGTLGNGTRTERART